MLDFQRIVDDLRGSLYAQDEQGLDFLRLAAAEYSLACDEVNDRLRKCGMFLRQGLRSEAIQLSENDPNLLDVVAILDFPERREWVGMVNRYGIAPPTPLKLDVATELNQAYALEQPLADLLRRHRLLALSHGPLAARIAVLRRLAELDCNNPVWQEDLAVFEGERQKQIHADLETATRIGDGNTVAALCAELRNPGWTNPPPKDVLASAADAMARMQYWSVQTEFQKIVQALEKAMTNFDIEQGRTLRETWKKLIDTYGYPPETPTAQKAQPVLCWLQEMDELRERQQQRETASRGLEWAVQSARSPEQLSEFHQQAEKLGEIPKDLEDAYRARLALLDRRARHRWWATRIGIAAAATVATIFAGTFLTRHFIEREVESAAMSMSKMIDASQYEEAQSLLHDLPEHVREAPRLRQMAATLQKKMEKERARQTEFTQQLQSAKLSLEGVSKSLAQDPGQSVLERSWLELEHCRKVFHDLHTLAKNEADRKNLSESVKLSAEVDAKWQKLIDRAFDRQYQEFDKRLAQLEGDERSETEVRKQDMQKLRTEMHSWKIASSHVSPSEQKRLSTLDERRIQLDSQLTRQEAESADLKKISDAVGDAKAYVRALQDFAKNQPTAECVGAFNRVIDESSDWEAMAEWSDSSREFRQIALLAITPEAAQRHIETLESLSQKFADSPDSAISNFNRTYLPVLKAISQRIEDGERIEVSLKNMIADPLVADVWMIEKQDGNRYYLKTEPNLKQSGSIQYVITFDGNTKGTVVKEEDVKFAGRAPQVAVSGKLRSILGELRGSNWEKSFGAMLATIAADQETDPFLKFNLLQQVLETGARGSSCFAEIYSPHLAWLKEAQINAAANWLDPKTTNPAAREAAAKIIKSFPPLVEPSQSLEKKIRFLEESRIPQFRWVGWLHRAKDGRWECAMSRKEDTSGALFAIGRASSKEKPSLAAVGRLDRLQGAIIANTGSMLVEGRPVYLEVP